MAAGVLGLGHDTPTDFRVSWPELGLCPPLVGIFLWHAPAPAAAPEEIV